MKHFLVLTLACLLTATPGDADTPPATPQKAVLVTGASTGIGRNITERLAASGYFVYAGARKDADLQALGAIKNVQAVQRPQNLPISVALEHTPASKINFDIEMETGTGKTPTVTPEPKR